MHATLRSWRVLFVLASTLVLPLSSRAADPTGIAAFTRHAKYVDAKISPKGTYLAVVTVEDGRRSLAFVNLATRKFTSVLKPGGDTMVGSFHWANDERVVVELVDQDGDLDAPVSRGELYAVDADGRGGRLVYGYRAGEMQAGSHIRRGERDLGWAVVLATLPKDERHVLIEAASMQEVGDRIVRVYKLDVYTGVKTDVAVSPIRNARFLADEDGAPRIAWGLDEQVKPRFFYRDPDAGWRELASLRGFTKDSIPRSFASRDRTLYVTEPVPGGFGLFAVGLESGDRKLIFKGEKAPPRSFVLDRATRRVVAIESEPDLPTYDFLEAEHPISRVMKGLLSAYPIEHVRLLSRTDDDKKAVVHVYSDRDPGQFLLVDVDKMSAEPIVGVRPWIKPDAMAEMSAFHIAASDGFKIHGYFTLPTAARPGVAPPLVVVPHGGPHFVRDVWGFDPEVQLLASEGFAVLQVNYRGSGGYGLAYQEAGYRKWGDRVVQDIIDATQWALAKGIADPKRVCIYGASFGGYAALQGAALAPDLFRCAVGYAGIYDLTLLGGQEGLVESRLGRSFVRTAVGEDAAALKSASPVYNAARIKANVLLIHGKLDRRAPIEHAERLRNAFAEKGKAVEWLVEPHEAHGFYDDGARERMYVKLLAFLRENTKPAAPAGPSSGSAPAQR